MRNVGICIGAVEEHFWDDRNLPDIETFGHHIIRNNYFNRCGQGGIVGAYGCIGSIIENNYISETNYRNEFGGAEVAGIKLHFPIDVVIRNNHNVYLEGAGKNKLQDQESAINQSEIKFNFQKGPNPTTISFVLSQKLFNKKYPLITSDLIGEFPVPKLSMENPDGTTLHIETDYYGNPINPDRVIPGPFQNIKEGKNMLKIKPIKSPL